jgi:hypothetical protein
LFLPLVLALRVECVGATIIAAVATYGLATRHTRSIALRVLVAALFVLGSRWALQLSVGHAWHLAYAWLPAVLWAFDIALATQRRRWLFLSAALLALQGYVGGIYPLPHTALALLLYAAVRGRLAGDRRPLLSALIVGGTALGLFAPKLVPIALTMRRFPRLIESTETIGPSQLLVMLTSPDQGLAARPVAVPAYAWHEWGLYVGWLGLGVLIIGALGVLARRARPFATVGLVLVALGFGAWGSLAPWTLLHRLPPFASMHVPSRLFFPAILFLSLAFVRLVGRRFDGLVLRRPWLDLASTIVVAWLVLDLAHVGARSTSQAFSLHPRLAPANLPPAGEDLRQLLHPRVAYDGPGAWGGAALLSRGRHEGVLACVAAPDGAEPRGARAENDARYLGEAHLEGGGTARIVSRTPNGLDVEVDAKKAGALIVNVNYDPGWRADGEPAAEIGYALATHVGVGRHVVRFRHGSSGLPFGLLVAGATLAAWLWLARRRPFNAA